MRRSARLLIIPFLDVWHGLERSLDRGVRGLLEVLGGLIVGWWLYVPAHELLHALGCLAAGGEVSRLEIDALYGGHLLAAIFPFVVPASDYAGRLSGFDTGGSDWVYLATDLAPFVLTVWPGVWLLRRAGARGWAPAYGFALPLALAPFLSLTGDAYEIGSILTTRLPPWTVAPWPELLRNDDVMLLVPRLAAQPEAPWGGVVVAFSLGVVWAFVTYGAGAVVARAVARGRKIAPPPSVG